MKLDISTLAFVSCLTFLAQFVALFVQYSVIRATRGVSWWLAGSAVWALGVIFMPLVGVKSLAWLAAISNPLTILAFIFLYIGLARFLGRPENRWVPISIFVAAIFFYYFFMLVDSSISARTAVLMLAYMALSGLAAAWLWHNADRPISGSAKFTALVFAAYGGVSVVRLLAVLTSAPIQTYSDQELFLELSFLAPMLASLLWTFGFIIMVNQRLNAENHEEKEKLQLIFNTSPDAASISRLADGLIVDVNDGYLVMSGYTRAELIGHSSLGINIWHQPADRERFVAELKHKGLCENLEFVFQRKDGRLLTGSVSAKIITLKAVPHIVTVVHDITHSKQVEEAIRESEELYRSILNASPDDITITDLQGHILVISPAAKLMFGYPPEYDDFLGAPLLDYLVPEDRERARANILRMFTSGYTGPNEYRGVRQDGSLIDIEVNSGIIHGANQQPAKMVFMVRDVTERKQAEQQIQQLVQQLEIEKQAAQRNANTDSLTGLANRRYFDEALDREYHRLQRSGLPLSLIMLDVDQFKRFNDRYGHLAGDDCLRQIGAMLKTLVGRVTDMAARYGGEEFVVLLPETDPSGAATLAERLRKTVEALAIPHAGSDVADWVTVSLGVVTVYTTQLASPEQAVALADAALYCAKKGGRNRTSVTTTENVLLEQTA